MAGMGNGGMGKGKYGMGFSVNKDKAQKKPFDFSKGFNLTAKGNFKIWRRPTLPHVTAVPSALAGLTSLFGLGRGGHRRYRHLNIFIQSLRDKAKSEK